MAGQTWELSMPAKAKWAQIADGIRAEIQSGALAPGDKLPSTSELCRQHGVSAIVVRQAINALKIEGFLEGVGGVGVFVAERAGSQ
ncbi:winged helix-turn-helix domain-containing protein [Micromonospora sp. WMMD1128]|uniref:winged helix-turn-helix domain-containing protein n=1 Tax=unclassified Micromonospora TaxID=2617518 RepID=UPI00248C0EF9|nr:MULTISPECIES: winged helix-turn-helix domain-containing protein [unclassified Micromonospora]WBB75382.1 winged helix-turn-helix domain-containing protein [Micromonospora sp. WMMD1128]WFE31227.1 winged helix-turn-helix domain-containing protein [Micromonospora sp. WMMD975]